MKELKHVGDAEARKDWTVADLAPILEALRGLRYGSVELIIQDYRLIQIDRKEKIRSFKT
jgi:hypothetical protein